VLWNEVRKEVLLEREAKEVVLEWEWLLTSSNDDF
jgi:hypothetical protein